MHGLPRARDEVALPSSLLVWVRTVRRYGAKTKGLTMLSQINQPGDETGSDQTETEVCHGSRVRESGRREGDRAGAERQNQTHQPTTLTGFNRRMAHGDLMRVEPRFHGGIMSRPPSMAAPGECGEAYIVRRPTPGRSVSIGVGSAIIARNAQRP